MEAVVGLLKPVKWWLEQTKIKIKQTFNNNRNKPNEKFKRPMAWLLAITPSRQLTFRLNLTALLILHDAITATQKLAILRVYTVLTTVTLTYLSSGLLRWECEYTSLFNSSLGKLISQIYNWGTLTISTTSLWKRLPMITAELLLEELSNKLNK